MQLSHPPHRCSPSHLLETGIKEHLSHTAGSLEANFSHAGRMRLCHRCHTHTHSNDPLRTAALLPQVPVPLRWYFYAVGGS